MKNIPKMIEATLSVLAEKFGSTGVHLWNVIIKQQSIDGWISVIEVVVGFTLIFAVIIPWAKAIISHNWDSIAWVSLGIITLLLGIFILYNIENAIKKFSNPEYTALESVTGMFKSTE